jgi:hypothetical protein
MVNQQETNRFIIILVRSSETIRDTPYKGENIAQFLYDSININKPYFT